MRLHVYAICWNEAEMMPYFLRHYSQFADRITVFDEQSEDGTREIIKSFPKAVLAEWPFKGLDDVKFLEAVNGWWKESNGNFDWVSWPDVDELLWHQNPKDAMDKANGDVIKSVGYALISPCGWPSTGDQIYDEVRTGVRQPNYDKQIIWRPHLNMVHTIGRHTYHGQYPKHNGKLASNALFKLLHCHHAGGVLNTDVRNRRNLERAVDKKFAWNYLTERNHANQPGTVAWVKSMMTDLENIFPQKL